MAQTTAYEPRDLYSATWYPVPNEEFRDYEAAVTIQEGQAVQHPSGDVAARTVEPSTAASVTIVGIAAADAAAGDKVRVQVRGVYPTARVAGTVGAGELLVGGSTDGELEDSATPDVGTVVGVALADVADGRAPVLLKSA